MELPELDTRSVLDVVEENFKAVSLKSYAIRMIYIGEHAVPKTDLISFFQKSMRDVNSGYCDIHVNGLLLVYDSYFVHIIEGSEDTVHRQLRFLFKFEEDWIQEMIRLDEEAAAASAAAVTEEDAELEDVPVTVLLEETPQEKPERKIFKRLKLLMVYHSVTRLKFSSWRALLGRPPSLVGKLDVYAPLPQHIEQLKICLDKITKLCVLAEEDAKLSFEGLGAADPKMEALPEVALLDYLLQSPHIIDLRHAVHLHRRVDDYIFYFEHVWPLPTHFTPRLLYKLKIDDSFVEPLPVMPWELVKKVKEEDEDADREEQSGSSSSD